MVENPSQCPDIRASDNRACNLFQVSSFKLRASDLTASPFVLLTGPLPLVAIGGIDLDRVGEVIRAGAAAVAVITAVAAAEDPVAATRSLASAIRDATQ